MKILKPRYWQDYELLDFGDGIKIEKFANKLLLRPETEAKKKLKKSKKYWLTKINSQFADKEPNNWSNSFLDWEINYKSNNFSFKLELFLGNSKHVGVFPEQASNWEFISNNLNSKDVFLNLFGYTAAASIVAANFCKQVTHVDSSPSIIKRAKKNAQINNIKNIRFINDDALQFCRKELKRGKKYNGIILDPPVFGFGTKGKSWKLTKNISELLNLVNQLTEENTFIILNTYSPAFNQKAALNIIHEIFDKKNNSIEYGKLSLESANNQVLLLNDYYIIKV